MPPVVKVVAFLMVMELMCGFWIAGIGAVGLLSNGLLQAPLPRIALAQFFWQLLLAAVLIRPLLRRHPTAWAAVEAVLLCQAAAGVARVVLLLSQKGAVWLSATTAIILDGTASLVHLAVVAVLAVLLFRARGWFGVGERQGWRTLWKRGWWALIATAALDLAFLVALAVSG